MAEEDVDFEARAPWHIDDVPPQQDRIPHQDRIPQQDQVPPQSDRVPPPTPEEPDKRQRRRTLHAAKVAAVAVLLLAGLTVGAVEPVRLWNHGWNTAQHLRGTGAGRGVFTVTSCGASHKDSNGGVYWDCDGVFTQAGADPVQATVYDEHHDHAGVTRRAYIDSDRSIGLASSAQGGAMLALWASLALCVLLIEAVAWLWLAGWIFGDTGLGEAASSLLLFGMLSMMPITFLLIGALAIAFAVVQS